MEIGFGYFRKTQKLISFKESTVEILENIILAPYTSWLIGGEADYFCLPENEQDLKKALQFASEKKISVHLLGGGSNVLVSDLGVRGLVIGLKKFSEVRTEVVDGFLKIHCGSGTSKSELLKIFLKYKLAPALFLAGLPGDVGGGIVMNAGIAENIKPREFQEIVESFDVLGFENNQFQTTHYTHDQVQWSYRHSSGWKSGVITNVSLSWPLHEVPEILSQVREANKIRLQKQPLDLPSCGSVFKNPENFKAAQLIDQCGLKGYQCGMAQVSKKHANFIVNLGGATATDVWAVIKHVQKVVWDQKQIQLRTEVIRFGKWSEN